MTHKMAKHSIHYVFHFPPLEYNKWFLVDMHKLDAIHVVGENKLESSTKLALRPVAGEADNSLVDATDFVNVQAIIARACCQAWSLGPI